MKVLDRLLLGSTAVLVVIAAGTVGPVISRVARYYGPPRAIQVVEDWERYHRDAPHLGPDSAEIRIVEFMDYACGACKGVQPALDSILKENPTRVSIAIRFLPIVSPESRLAAYAAICADRQGHFREFHRLLLDYRGFHLGHFETSFVSIAYRSGVSDTLTLKRCVENPEVIRSIEADTVLAEGIGVNATPSFMVNGTLYPGTQRTLKKVIENLTDSLELRRERSLSLGDGSALPQPPKWDRVSTMNSE